MLNSTDEWLARERYQAALRQACQERLVRQALAQRQRPIYSPALAWLGRRLSCWGQRLLARYSPPELACA